MKMYYKLFTSQSEIKKFILIKGDDVLRYLRYIMCIYILTNYIKYKNITLLYVDI